MGLGFGRLSACLSNLLGNMWERTGELREVLGFLHARSLHSADACPCRLAPCESSFAPWLVWTLIWTLWQLQNWFTSSHCTGEMRSDPVILLPPDEEGVRFLA